MRFLPIASTQVIIWCQVIAIVFTCGGCSIDRPKPNEAWRGWDDHRAEVVDRLKRFTENQISSSDRSIIGTPQNNEIPVSRGMRPNLPKITRPIEVEYSSNHVLIIAESAYNNGWDPLPGVLNDVQQLTASFEKQGFVVDVLKNTSGPDLRESLHRFMSEHGDPQGRIIVCYLGHGYTQIQTGGKQVGYLVPVEAPNPETDPVGFRTVAVPLTYIESEARSATIHHALFLFDCCFAGTIFDTLPRMSTSRCSVSDIRSQPVRQFLSAGSEKQTVPDASIFTPLVIRALNGAADDNRDGIVTGNELGWWVTEQVTKQSHGKQTPLFGNIRDPALCKGDLVFTYSKTESSKEGIDQAQDVKDELNDWRSTHRLSRFSPSILPPIGKPSWATEYNQDEYGVWADLVVGKATQRFRFCPPGNITFQGRSFVQSQGFWLADSECTQSFWKATLSESPSFFSDRSDQPVERISFLDAQRCCTHLRTTLGIPFRLPTQSEWQYVAAVGSSELPEAGWHRRNSRLMTQPVCLAPPNIWGIHDLLGNVSEWCDSCEDEKPRCGGSWDTPPNACTPLSVRTALPEVKTSMTGCRFLIEYKAER